jgi:hypothetical protein
MTAVTYGAFLDQAARHLASAERSRDRNTAYAQTLTELHRMTVAVARNLATVMSGDVISAQVQPRWQRKAVDLREAMYLASDDIAAAIHETMLDSTPRASHTVVRLSDASDALSAAHDLLRTHVGDTPEQYPVELSSWAKLLTTESVVVAMTEEMYFWADRIATWLTWIRADDTRTAQERLYRASEWLRTTGTVGDNRSTQVSGGHLLRGFTSAVPSNRIAPDETETAVELHDGVARTAGRLRAATFTLPQAALSPVHASGPAWLRTSSAAAIVSDIASRMLRQLANQPRARKTELRQAAVAFDTACAAWRQTASMWQLITTDTQHRITPIAAEINDLMLRMGRLAFADPGWTPQNSRNTPLKEAAELAPGRTGRAAIVGTIHQAADALAAMARADLAAITAIGLAGRLYMPNIVLWDERAGELNYASAPPDRIALLRDVYRVIITTSTHAAKAMDALALATGAPSQILALARQASPREPDTDALDLAGLGPRLQYFARPKRQPIPEPDYPPPDSATPPADEPVQGASQRPAPELRCGPLEFRMRTANVTDQATLLRAAAIDRAGDELFNKAAKLAAQDVPDRPGAGLTHRKTRVNTRGAQPRQGRSTRPRTP